MKRRVCALEAARLLYVSDKSELSVVRPELGERSVVSVYVLGAAQ